MQQSHITKDILFLLQLPHGSLSNLSVKADNLDTEVLQKTLLPNVGFRLKNIKFDGSTLGVREIVVEYNTLTDKIKLEVLPGRPAKLNVMGWMQQEVWLLGGGGD